MNELLIAISLLMPMIAASAVSYLRSHWLSLIATVPALLAGLLLDDTILNLPWLLLGTELAINATNRPFLLVAAVVWLAAGMFCLRFAIQGTRSLMFRLCLLLAMAGNFLVILSQDAVSFYVGFTLMGLSTYALIRAPLTKQAKRASLYYLLLTLIAEIALFLGLVMAVIDADSHYLAQMDSKQLSNLTMALLLLAAGIKGAIFGLHGWLIAAHSSAPYPASAVMSGLMVKAGALILLKFFPLGEAEIGWAGYLLIGAGGIGAIFGLVMALRQSHPKVLLAWSTMSKVGLIFVGFGLLMLDSTLYPVLLPALVIYASSHSLVKGALFLNLGTLSQRRLPWLLGLLPLLQSRVPQAATSASFVDWLAPWLLIAASLTIPFSQQSAFQPGSYLPLIVAALLLLVLVLRHQIGSLTADDFSVNRPLYLLKRAIRRLGLLFKSAGRSYSLRVGWLQRSLLNNSESVYPSVSSVAIAFLLFLLLIGEP